MSAATCTCPICGDAHAPTPSPYGPESMHAIVACKCPTCGWGHRPLVPVASPTTRLRDLDLCARRCEAAATHLGELATAAGTGGPVMGNAASTQLPQALGAMCIGLGQALIAVPGLVPTGPDPFPTAAPAPQRVATPSWAAIEAQHAHDLEAFRRDEVEAARAAFRIPPFEPTARLWMVMLSDGCAIGIGASRPEAEIDARDYLLGDLLDPHRSAHCFGEAVPSTENYLAQDERHAVELVSDDAVTVFLAARDQLPDTMHDRARAILGMTPRRSG